MKRVTVNMYKRNLLPLNANQRHCDIRQVLDGPGVKGYNADCR